MSQHIVNISGGKDSTACYLLAMERGRPFRAIMADVGSNENEITRDYAERLAERTGGPQVEFVRADFTRELAGKRRFVETKWRDLGVPEATIERALAVLHPTGDPFVDLTLWKGRFPSRKAQFCTEFLKARAIEDGVVEPALRLGRLVQWLGIRRDESLNRRDAPMFQRVRREGRHDMLFYRPIIHWTAEDTFALAKRHGLPPNPLYLLGARRVGCWPCINSGKEDLIAVQRVDGTALPRLLEWEALVKDASKRGAATFFASDVTPQGAALAQRLKRRAHVWMAAFRPDLHPGSKEYQRAYKARMSETSAGAPWPNSDDVFAWAKTERGGRQVSLETWARDQDPDEGLSCSSHYGLCE